MKKAAVASSAPFWLQSCDQLFRVGYPVAVRSDQQVGHLLLESRQWKVGRTEDTGVVIVGGGIAGVAAAASLGERDYHLLELSDRFGGSSSAHRHNGAFICQGAHYELAYPHDYGEDVLAFLEKLEIIRYEPWSKLWSFTDTQHLIPYARRQQCYENGKLRGEVLSPGYARDRFYELMAEYERKMPLPSRLIAPDLRSLNDITFLDFLSRKMEVPPDFRRQLDYHMLDDWGGRTDQVSALAGIHYFACRPYLSKHVALFSPPEGNAYFLHRMLEALDKQKLKAGQLVAGIRKNGAGFDVDVVDAANTRRYTLKAEQVIYAGQKHAVRYIYPEEAHFFEQQQQAPWMVLNFVCEPVKKKYGFWQNEYLGDNDEFLGFVDGGTQAGNANERVFTAYYCLRPERREYLTTVDAHKQEIASRTQSFMEDMLGERLKVKACFIHVMGHAMSIPAPGFLFNDANEKGADLIYAGVDNGRLPLLFEALDSGLMAASLTNA